MPSQLKFLSALPRETTEARGEVKGRGHSASSPEAVDGRVMVRLRWEGEAQDN